MLASLVTCDYVQGDMGEKGHNGTDGTPGQKGEKGIGGRSGNPGPPVSAALIHCCIPTCVEYRPLF